MYYFFEVNNVKLILELLLILGLIVVTFLMFIALCTYLSSLIEKAKKKYCKQKKSKCLNKTIKFYNKCKRFVRLHRSMLSIILFICIMLGVPLAVQNNQMNIGTEFKKYIKIGTPRDWFGFWGSYIGGILSIAFAFYNTKWQLNTHKYANDYKQFTVLKKASDDYLKIIRKYKWELQKIKDETNEDKYKDINKFTHKYSTDFNKYFDVYNKVLSELSSLTSMKAFELLAEYLIDNAEFIINLHKLQSQKATPNDWEKAINMADTVFENFHNLNQKIFKLWDKCNVRS